jgi:hypothetical protein
MGARYRDLLPNPGRDPSVSRSRFPRLQFERRDASAIARQEAKRTLQSADNPSGWALAAWALAALLVVAAAIAGNQVNAWIEATRSPHKTGHPVI